MEAANSCTPPHHNTIIYCYEGKKKQVLNVRNKRTQFSISDYQSILNFKNDFLFLLLVKTVL